MSAPTATRGLRERVLTGLIFDTWAAGDLSCPVHQERAVRVLVHRGELLACCLLCHRVIARDSTAMLGQAS
jgi:hypothetical protein